MLDINTQIHKYNKSKNVKLLFIILILLVVGGVFLFIYGTFVGNHKLTTSNYKVEADISSEIRIVQLTDLHNTKFGKDNTKLIKLIKEQQPDIIVITGDMINKDEEDIGIICSLIEELSLIADVYYGYGNHETAWITAYGDNLRKNLENAGAVVLDTEYIDVEIKDESVRIAGYMGYYGAAHLTAHTEEEKIAQNDFMKSFENTDRFKILLNHIPTAWVDWGYIDKYSVDIVLSGHYHGGLVRFFNRGLYAPYVGLFPEHTKGIYRGETATCILSAGLGSEYMIPRLNNSPEIVIVDLVPQE